MISSAERRMYLNGEENTVVRVSDFISIIPAELRVIPLLPASNSISKAFISTLV